MENKSFNKNNFKRSKNIGIIHYTAPPSEAGGVEIAIAAQTEFLSSRGYQVHLIYGSGGGFNRENVIEHSIPLLSPKNQKILEIQKDILKSERETEEFLDVKKEIKQQLIPVLEKLDTCIVHNIPSMPFNFAATSAINDLTEELDLKFIYWIHDIAILRDEWKNRTGHFPLTCLLHKNRNITYVTVSHFRASQLEQLPDSHLFGKIHVIPNGVHVEDYLKIDKVTLDLMRKLGISFTDLVILIPVRVTPRKNIELALYVADELKRLMGDRVVKVLITGPPDHQAITMGMKYMEYLEHIIKRRGLEDNVIFCHDIIAHDRIRKGERIIKWSIGDAYAISDIVFIPSIEEGFGLPVIEAGAARKMVFCSRIPPFQELIREGIDGFMFDLHESPYNIAYRIYKEVVSDVVDSNFNNVMKRFSWETILSRRLLPLL
ncbi:MAG: glycosyltransferase family 4 protein [Nitrososphaeria archaeon]